MIDSRLLDRLKRIVGAEYVSTGRADREVYSYDASLAVNEPDAVVRPADTHQTAAVVRACCRAAVSYVPRGFGTNLSGGSIATRGGVIIEMSRLNRILAVRPESRYAAAQVGVTNLELQNALAPLGFFYAPDPASQKVATLGGNVGENSGGPHCLKYGVTGNHVLGMTAVLPRGEVVETGGPAPDPPGYDVRGVLVGSEGTLAIVTEVVVRILPSPESVVTLLAVYDDNADAARSVSRIIAAGIVPATLEMMDATVIRAVEASVPCGYPLDAAAVLIVEVDGPAAGLSRQAERIIEICNGNGCREIRRAKDAQERNRLWAGRRGAFGAIARLAPNYLVADCTVPRTRLPDALAQVAEIAESHGIEHGNVFHAGDGNLHPLLFFDSRDPGQLERVHEAGSQIMEACVALGGTITGEHGVGVEKAEAMRLVFSEEDLKVQRRLRDAFDPDDLLNPQKIIPPSISGEDGEPPRPAAEPISPGDNLKPADAAEACQLVRQAASDRVALVPFGSGSRQQRGNDDRQTITRLQSAKLAGVVDYDPANQFVVVGAGTLLGDLQAALAENAQWLPLRPPLGGRSTLGGIAALGACGPDRLRYGAPRDLALGLKFVSGTGRLISAGGRVVKNVAGYDLTRLLIGSAGTLGFITELTLRVSSLPECCMAWMAEGTLGACQAAAVRLLQSRLDPTLILATPNPESGKSGTNRRWRLFVAFEGFDETVSAQLDACEALLSGDGLDGFEPRRYAPGHLLWAGDPAELLESRFLARIDLPPAKVAAFLAAHADEWSDGTPVVDFGCGRILAAVEELTESTWEGLCSAAAQTRGHAVLERAPAGFRGRVGLFGPPRADWPVMHRVKAALDPHGVFVSARLPGTAEDGG
ncbi:MAG: FAD-binding oxidoreductase [Planctomycetota bacterium]|jgi:glycolate oxidase subunit GlcD